LFDDNFPYPFLGVNFVSNPPLSMETKFEPVYQTLKMYRGISNSVSKKLCLILSFDARITLFDLTQKDFERIESVITSKVIFDRELNFIVKKNINLHKRIKSYAGRRHSVGLPLRGQRTRSNGSTARKLSFYKEPLILNVKKKKK